MTKHSRHIVAIIQARMGSSRLPGKVLMDIGGETALARVIARLSRAKISEIVVATTICSADDAIVDETGRAAAKCFRGSEHDVLSRYCDAARKFRADLVVRITADCPLIDPALVDEVINKVLSPDLDFVSNSIYPTFPRGLDAEAFTIDALGRAEELSDQPHHREHVTPIFYERPDLFRTASVSGQEDFSRYRWTLDTAEDLQLIRAIYSHFANRDDFGWRDVIALMEASPDLVSINAHIQQKPVRELASVL